MKLAKRPDGREYGIANIFVGKYEVPEDGWLRFDAPRVRSMLQLPSQHAFIDDTLANRLAYVGAPHWLIVEDGDFWPIMVQLPEESE